MFLKDRLDINTKRQYTDEGFLIVPSRIARIGIQEYYVTEMGIKDRNPSDIIRVYRPEEEVFSEDSLSSFANKSVTDNHPSEMVTSKNSKDLSVGFSGPEVRKDGMFVETILRITDESAIKKIESGKVELSNGYTSDIDWTPGITSDGEEFDAVQRNIKGNHIAIVDRGRAGPACRLADNLPTDGDKVTMAKITIDGVDYEVSDQAAQAIGNVQQKLSDAENETQEEKDKLKAKEDEMEEANKKAKKTEDSLQAKLDDAKSNILTADELDTKVSERKALIDNILKIDPDVKWEGKDSNELIKIVVADKCPTVQMDSVSDDYIKARFDMLLESVDTNTQVNLDNALQAQLKGKETNDTRSPSVIARDKMIEQNRQAWQNNKGDK